MRNRGTVRRCCSSRLARCFGSLGGIADSDGAFMIERHGLPISVAALAEQIGATLRGEGQVTVHGLAPLESAGAADIAYVATPKYRKHLADTRAGAVLLTAEDAASFVGTALITDNPRLAFARAASIIYPEPAPTPGIHPSAVVGADVQIADSAHIGALTVVEAGAIVGEHVDIGPGCLVGAGSRLGRGTRLVARVTILAGCSLGERCLVHPGAVIGSDGFGYARRGESWVKVPQLGGVMIGNDVEIGANTAIDRGALGDTVIGDGVKLDNLIQIAHNVHVGAHTAIAGCVGIAGSTHIGKRCMIGGGAGIGGHLDITDDVTIMGKTSITNSISEPGVYSSTMAAQSATEWRKNAVRFRRLDEMARKLRRLEERIQQMLSGDHLE